MWAWKIPSLIVKRCTLHELITQFCPHSAVCHHRNNVALLWLSSTGCPVLEADTLCLAWVMSTVACDSMPYVCGLAERVRPVYLWLMSTRSHRESSSSFSPHHRKVGRGGFQFKVNNQPSKPLRPPIAHKQQTWWVTRRVNMCERYVVSCAAGLGGRCGEAVLAHFTTEQEEVTIAS